MPLRIGPDPREACANEPALQRCGPIAFLSRPYEFSAPLLKGRPIRHGQAVVICPSRELKFGDPTPARESVERRLVWIELAPERLPPTAPPLQRALGMVRLPEEQLPACSKAIRTEAAGSSLDSEIDDVIAAILVTRFSGRTAAEICAMGGITASALTLRLLPHRCGALTPSQRGRSQALSLTTLDRYGGHIWLGHVAIAKQTLGRISNSTLKRELTKRLQKL